MIWDFIQPLLLAVICFSISSKSLALAADDAISTQAPFQNSDPGSGSDSECNCVPYYLCFDGILDTTGGGIFTPRSSRHEERKRRNAQQLPAVLRSFTSVQNATEEPECNCTSFYVSCKKPKSFAEASDCGRRVSAIENGAKKEYANDGEADFGEWPWQAAILKLENGAAFFVCGGTLIDQRHVLTVAHCVQSFVNDRKPAIVRLGEFNAYKINEFHQHKDYDVAEIIVHPQFNNRSLHNGIAILRLAKEVEFRPHIRHICLPTSGEEYSGEKCVVAGWGKNRFGKGGYFSNQMKEIWVPVVKWSKCQEILRQTLLGKYFQLHNSFMCAGGMEDQDPCTGDSGGALACLNPGTNRYEVVGLVSWGVQCGREGVPGVYVRVEKFLDWIQDNIRDNTGPSSLSPR